MGRKRYRRRDQASTYRTGQKTGAETGRGTDRESEFPDYSYVLHAGSTKQKEMKITEDMKDLQEELMAHYQDATFITAVTEEKKNAGVE